MTSVDTRLTSSLGALEIGALISVFLFGVATVQSYTYYRSFPEDAWIKKALVTVVWLLELGHTICVSHAIYNTTIILYGQPEKLIKFQSLNVIILLGGLITMAVQLYFSLRVWHVLATRYVGVLCCVLSVARCVGSFVATIKAFEEESLVAFCREWNPLITTLLVVGTSVDIMIAAAMCYFLKQQRKGAFVRSARLIDTLIAWTIQTGLITSIAAVVMVICFQMVRDNFVWLSIYTFLAKLYSNCLLATLNSRTRLREVMNNTSLIEIPGIQSGEEHTIKSKFIPTISIEMIQTTEITVDKPTNRLAIHDSDDIYPAVQKQGCGVV